MGVVTFAGGKVGMAAPSGLPAGYTKLAYIQSSGKQYINTGVAPTNDTVVKIHNFSTENRAAEPWEVFIGSQTSDNSADTWQLRRYMYDFTFRYQIGATDPSVQAAMQNGSEIILGTNSLSINGTEHSFTPASISSKLPLYLFACNQNGTPFRKSTCSLGRVEIWKGGVLVRDMCACLSETDGVGLYDMVEGKFYANAGSGTFTGSEVA